MPRGQHPVEEHPGPSRAAERRRPLRILRLVLRYGPDTAGGHATYAFQLGRVLAERGHEFHVLCCAPHLEDRDYLEDAVHVHARRGAVSLRRRSSRRLPMTRHRVYLPMTRHRVYQLVSHWRETRRLGIPFDVIESPEFGACGLLLALRSSQPLVVRLHTPAMLEAPFRAGTDRIDVRISDRLERTLARRATLLTAATHAMGTRLTRAGWLDGQPVRVVRNPTDLSFWAAAEPVQRTDAVVLAVGRLEARKAPELLVRAMARLKQDVPAARLVLLGRSNGKRDGIPYRDWVARLAAELGVTCEFLDEVPRHELPRIYGQARVLAIPSWQEGFSNAGLEAMSAGRPVVCTSSTGLTELIQGTAAGTVVPAGDDAQLASALLPFLRSAERAADAGASGLEIARAQCEPHAVARQAEDCYYEAVHRWGSARSRR